MYPYALWTPRDNMIRLPCHRPDRESDAEEAMSRSEVSVCVLAAVCLISMMSEGYARNRHEALSRGYHCPLGQYWRPSLRLCQGMPYRGYTTTRSPEGQAFESDHSDPVPLTVRPRRTVETETRILGRRRSVSPDGVTVSYVVQTRVKEHYPAPRLSHP